MHQVALLSIGGRLNPLLYSCTSPSVALSVKNRSQLHIATIGQGFEYVLGSVASHDKQETYEQLSYSIKTVFDHPGNNTQYAD